MKCEESIKAFFLIEVYNDRIDVTSPPFAVNNEFPFSILFIWIYIFYFTFFFSPFSNFIMNFIVS